MFTSWAVIFSIVCGFSLVLSFMLCGDDDGIIWPFKIFIASFVMMFACAIIASIRNENDKTKRYDCLCHICNQLYQVKKLDDTHVVKISPYRSVYVCDKCFYQLNEVKEEKTNERTR